MLKKVLLFVFKLFWLETKESRKEFLGILKFAGEIVGYISHVVLFLTMIFVAAICHDAFIKTTEWWSFVIVVVVGFIFYRTIIIVLKNFKIMNTIIFETELDRSLRED